MSDYYATLKIQQGRLKSAMSVMGISTVAELSRRCGVSQTCIGELMNFRVLPRRKNGEWRTVVITVCSVLGVDPPDMFPEHLEHEVPSNEICSYVEQSQLSGRTACQLSPSDECEASELAEMVDSALSTLTDQEQRIMRARFWGSDTREEIASEYGICTETVRRIEKRAIRKLRHSSRSEFMEGLL